MLQLSLKLDQGKVQYLVMELKVLHVPNQLWVKVMRECHRS
jgi:hypothetical protein